MDWIKNYSLSSAETNGFNIQLFAVKYTKKLVPNKIISVFLVCLVYLVGGKMGKGGKTVGGIFYALANIRLDNIKKM